ncbi:MAG TPA: hypothetical protein VGO53_16170 [Steroidobacteraceae bacterium]|jgi:hypothetical protein|nr:hypothetical protein [Steroidobacteraceae bacterium]
MTMTDRDRCELADLCNRAADIAVSAHGLSLRFRMPEDGRRAFELFALQGRKPERIDDCRMHVPAREVGAP